MDIKELLVSLGNINMLIVEDDPFSRLLIKSLLSKLDNISFWEAENGLDAIEVMNKENIDICLLDLHMPKMNGFEVLEQIKKGSRYSHISVVIMTTETDIKQKLYDKGADGFIVKPFDLNDLRLTVYNTIKNKQSIVKKVSTKKRVNYSKDSIEKSQREFFNKLASLKVISDPIEKLEMRVISRIVKEFANKLGFTANEIQNIYIASKLKDIGLMGVKNTWDSSNKFSELDRRNYGKYILLGHQLLSNSIETDFIKVAKNVVLQYREAYDGSGVPYQIEGESISKEAMIVMIVETFEALLSHRSYRTPPSYTYQEAYELFDKLGGKKFDPILSNRFLQYFSEFVEIRKEIVNSEVN